MKEYKKLFKSFVYAFCGIGKTAISERNFRIHITCIIYMFSILIFGGWFSLSRAEWAILIICCGIVLSLELINTAVEKTVDLISKERTELGKTAKDAAAGAVLLGAIMSVAVGFAVLFQPEAFRKMYEYFSANIISLSVFILSAIPATIFIFWGSPFKKGK